MAPVVEFLSMDASEAYLADPNLVHKLSDILKQVDGFIKGYHGFEQENNQKAYAALVWETYEHHGALMESPSYPEVVDAFKLLLATPHSFTMHHFELDPTASIEAPITEVAFLTLKAGQDKGDLGGELITLSKALDVCKGAHPPCAWGVSREQLDLTLLLVGWDTVQIHVESVYGSGGPTDIIERIGKLAGVSFSHVSFTKV